MIVDSQNAFFVHVPKTGGQSVERLFLELEGLTWSERSRLGLGPNRDRTRGPHSLAHLRASEYVRYDYLSARQFDAYYSFSFVRNPWARLVSEFRYRNLPRWVSFRRWVYEHLPPTPEWSDSYDHLAPQHEYVCDKKGTVLVDFVGRFERLAEDFRRVADELCLPIRDLPHTNSSTPTGSGASWSTCARVIAQHPRRWRKDYTTYYDQRTRDLVADVYASDVEMFGYSFDS